MKKQRASSLIRKINGYIQWRRLGKYLGADCLFACGAVVLWGFAIESSMGALDLFRPRYLHYEVGENWTQTLRSLSYTFRPGESSTLYQVELGPVFEILLVAMPALLLLQLLLWGGNWSKNERYLRKLMRPIDEAALAAERISTSGIDEGKLHSVEQVIDNITDSGTAVHIGDQDLQGLESAINNLLKRLRTSYEEQTRFVDDASHELRTPIAVIHGYAAMLERWGMDDRKTMEESVHAILEESEHMQSLVEQLLFLARGDGGRQNLEFERVELGGLLREVQEESAMIDSAHRYACSLNGEAFVFADQAMLKQAIRILTDNAAKYTPEGGEIVLFLTRERPELVGICVKDEGIGLSPEEAAHLFERFFRGDQVRGSTKGSGLGLSIAKWIVERHNGSIEVLGYQGIGTKVTIWLKLASFQND